MDGASAACARLAHLTLKTAGTGCCGRNVMEMTWEDTVALKDASKKIKDKTCIIISVKLNV